MDIGIAFVNVRKKKGIRQNVAAKSIGISQTYLSQIEGNKKSPSMDLVEKMCKVYDVPLGIMFWNSITVDDVSKKKLTSFKMLKPSIDAMIDEMFLSK